MHHAVENGLRPLAVTMDNGLNDSTANNNIRQLCNNLGVDLISHVIDWDEYSEMLKSMLFADVIDIEILYDNACQGVCYNYVEKYGIKYILSGSNTFTEGMVAPPEISWYKNDVKNILDILYKYQKSQNKKLKKPKTYPFIGGLRKNYLKIIRNIQWVKYLDYLNYNKREAEALLSNLYKFKPYGHKHFENVMTRLYQGYILPKKFHVEKERWHLSMEIISNIISKDQATKELNLLSKKNWQDDINYICETLKEKINFLLTI